jgi:hypothetical protein
MAVQWTTLNSTHAGVRWRAEGEKNQRSALSEVQTYTREEMCGEPASGIGWSDPGLLHWAVMEDLKPGSRYVYSVGDVYGPPPPPSPHTHPATMHSVLLSNAIASHDHATCTLGGDVVDPLPPTPLPCTSFSLLTPF